MPYSFPYLLLSLFFLCLWLLELSDKNKEKQVRKTCICLFVVFFAFRGFVAWDWQSYHEWFGMSVGEILDYPKEKGFIYFMASVKYLTDDYHVFVFINSIIDLYLIDKIFSFYSYRNYALMFFLYMVFYLPAEMDLLRNIKSILLFYYSLRYAKVDMKRYVFINLIGIMFHLSSLFYLLFSLFLFKPLNRKLILCLFLVGNVFFLCHLGIFSLVANSLFRLIDLGPYQLLYEAYLNSDRYSGDYGLSYGYFERILTFILVYKYSERILKKDDRMQVFITLFYTFIFLTLYASDFFIIIGRGGLLLRFSYIILLPQLFQSMTSMLIKKMYLCFFISFSLLRINASTNNIMYDYENILTGARSYTERRYMISGYLKEFDL